MLNISVKKLKKILNVAKHCHHQSFKIDDGCLIFNHVDWTLHCKGYQGALNSDSFELNPFREFVKNSEGDLNIAFRTAYSGSASIDFETVTPPNDIIIKDGVAFKISGPTLVDIFKSLQHAISKEETRYYLNGCYVHPDGDTFTAVATDGNVMVIRRNCIYDLPDFKKVIVPTEACKIITALFDNPADIIVTVEDAHIMFENDDYRFVSKVIDGTFPDYTRVIPNNTGELTFDSLKMLTVLKHFVKSEYAVKFEQVGEVLQLTQQFNTTTGIVPACFEADFPRAGLNAKYLTNALKYLKGEVTLKFEVADDNYIESVPAPVMLGNSRHTVIIMPIKF